jgi:fumarylacetoacetate (FAA) hydrolase family protein
LQVIKAAGVTFAVSMLERVIEERARGNPDSATAMRAEVTRIVGTDLSRLKPGSAEAQHVKDVLVAQNAWSQYHEVGIGPDAANHQREPSISGWFRAVPRHNVRTDPGSCGEGAGVHTR